VKLAPNPALTAAKFQFIYPAGSNSVAFEIVEYGAKQKRKTWGNLLFLKTEKKVFDCLQYKLGFQLSSLFHTNSQNASWTLLN